MTRLLALFALLLPTVLAGCPSTGDDDDSAPPADDDDVADDDDATGDDDDSTPCEMDPCETTADTGYVGGTLLLPDGTPGSCLVLTVCSDAQCIFTNASEDGEFCVDGLNPDDYVVHNLSYPGEDAMVDMFQWSSFYDFAPVVAGQATTFPEDFVVPEVSEAIGDLVGDTSIAYFNGELQLDFDAQYLHFPPPSNNNPAPTLGAVKLPENRWPTNGLLDWGIVAAWHFAPFETALIEEAEPDDIEHEFDITINVGPQDPAMEYALLYAHYQDITADIATGHFTEAPAVLAADNETITGQVKVAGALLLVKR